MVKGEATMSEHTFDDRDMTGYFLPEDSQVLLKQLSGHLRLLARLAQPRMANETEAGAPLADTAELADRLDQLAEQLDLVLKDVSWLERSPSHPASRDPLAKTAEEHDEALGQDTGEGDDPSRRAYRAQADDLRFVFGVTLDQYDRLRLLVASIKAFGDAVFADASADFAAGTLSMLGFTIFDRAVEVDDLLGEIDAQTLEQGTRLRVEEPRAAYGVQVPSDRAPMACAGLATAYLSLAHGPSLGGVLVH
jgi:hypothetical protein